MAHSALLDAFGIEHAKNLLLHFQTKHQTDARQQIQDFTQSGDIAIAFSNHSDSATRVGLRGTGFEASNFRRGR